MCGTMQTPEERIEAAAIYPKWGEWLTELEKEALRLHGFGWGQNAPKVMKPLIEQDLPMCSDCIRRGTSE